MQHQIHYFFGFFFVLITYFRNDKFNCGPHSNWIKSLFKENCSSSAVWILDRVPHLQNFWAHTIFSGCGTQRIQRFNSISNTIMMIIMINIINNNNDDDDGGGDGYNRNTNGNQQDSSATHQIFERSSWIPSSTCEALKKCLLSE